MLDKIGPWVSSVTLKFSGHCITFNVCNSSFWPVTDTTDLSKIISCARENLPVLLFTKACLIQFQMQEQQPGVGRILVLFYAAFPSFWGEDFSFSFLLGFPLVFLRPSGHILQLRHISHSGPTGRHVCWPNPTNNTLSSSHSSLIKQTGEIFFMNLY